MQREMWFIIKPIQKVIVSVVLKTNQVKMSEAPEMLLIHCFAATFAQNQRKHDNDIITQSITIAYDANF